MSKFEGPGSNIAVGAKAGHSAEEKRDSETKFSAGLVETEVKSEMGSTASLLPSKERIAATALNGREDKAAFSAALSHADNISTGNSRVITTTYGEYQAITQNYEVHAASIGAAAKVQEATPICSSAEITHQDSISLDTANSNGYELADCHCV